MPNNYNVYLDRHFEEAQVEGVLSVNCLSTGEVVASVEYDQGFLKGLDELVIHPKIKAIEEGVFFSWQNHMQILREGRERQTEYGFSIEDWLYQFIRTRQDLHNANS